MSQTGEPCADDGIQLDAEPIGYRLVLDLDHEDADLIDRVAHEEGLQPTQILLRALRIYATRENVHVTQVKAISEFGAALRRVA